MSSPGAGAAPLAPSPETGSPPPVRGLQDRVPAVFRALEARFSASSRRRWYWAICVLLVVLGSSEEVLHYLVFWPLDQWQADLEVYRQAGASILIGRPMYATLTEAPQLLPFTYPPFAGVLAIPAALVPFGVAGWIWTALQLLADAAIVWYAGRELLIRAGSRAPLLLGVLTVPLLWVQPVSEGLRFGQVNAFLVLAALVDLQTPRPRLVSRIPPGMLVGLATAVKLTPGVFIVHYLVNRRWREAAWAIGTALGVSLATAALVPQASLSYWGVVLQDPGRLGPNAGPGNQSLRGFVLRQLGEGPASTAVWVVFLLVVGAAGFAVARRAYRRDQSVVEVGALGMMAALLSPVAWVHHYHWVMVVILALLGANPLADRRRLALAALLWGWFMIRFLLWSPGLARGSMPGRLVGQLMQSGFMIGGLLAVAALWFVSRRTPDAITVPGGTPDAAAVPGGTLDAAAVRGGTPDRGRV